VGELTIEGQARLDLDELSALSRLAPGASSGELIGVSDSSFRIAIGSTEPVRGLEVSPSLEDHVRDHTHEPEKGSQWEGVATDGAGRVFVLQEHAGRARPSHVFVLSPTMDDLVAVIALEVHEGEADWKEKWREQERARRGARSAAGRTHPGDQAEGSPEADRVRARGKLPARPGCGALSWPRRRVRGRGGGARRVRATRVVGSRASGGRAARVDQRRDFRRDDLYVVSRSSRQIARLDVEVEPSDESLRVDRSWGLPDEIEQPEGLVVLEGMVPLVADDQEGDGSSRDNVFRLGTLRWTPELRLNRNPTVDSPRNGP